MTAHAELGLVGATATMPTRVLRPTLRKKGRYITAQMQVFPHTLPPGCCFLTKARPLDGSEGFGQVPFSLFGYPLDCNKQKSKSKAEYHGK